MDTKTFILKICENFMITDKDLQIVCENPDPVARQAFIDRVDLEGNEKYVSGLHYVDKSGNGDSITLAGKIERTTRAAVTTQNPLTKWALIPKLKSRIRIFPKLFEVFNTQGFNLGDLKSIIVDHEAFHAQEYFNAPWDIGQYGCFQWEPSVLRTELRAYANQQENFDRRGCTEEFRGFISSLEERNRARLKYLTT